MLPTSSDDWLPPPRFDGFELKSLLGQGGMGRFCLAHEEALDRAVAIKFILDGSLGERARERFLTEARAVGAPPARQHRRRLPHR